MRTVIESFAFNFKLDVDEDYVLKEVSKLLILVYEWIGAVVLTGQV